MPQLVQTGDWVFGARVVAVLAGVGFASAAFLVNQHLNQLRLGFLIVVAASFRAALRFGSLGFGPGAARFALLGARLCARERP
jgi:hypothetical protein